PEDSIQSAIWAVSKGNFTTWLDSLEPDLRQKVINSMARKSPAQTAEMVDKWNQKTGFHMKKHVLSDDEVLVEEYPDGVDVNHHDKFLMRKTAGEWKISWVDEGNW